MDYSKDATGRRLSQDERIARYQAQHPSPAKKATEPPRRLSSQQITDMHEARRLGKAEANKSNEPPDPNHWRRQLVQLEKTACTAHDFAQLKRFAREADRWDRDNADRLEREEIAAAKKADPAYKNAAEHATSFLKTVSEDFLAAASHAAGYLEESGDYSTYWSKIAEIETAVWAIEDQKVTELAMKANASMSEFKEQADKASAAAQRLNDAQVLGEAE